MILLTPVFCVGLTAGAADLGYEQALEQALSRNPTIQIAGAGVERADGALLAARAVFDTTLTANSNSSSTVTQSPQLQGVNIDDRNSSFGTTISHFFPTGTTTSLAWQNRQSTTLYLAENQTALDQLREFGLINEDIRYQSSLVATMRQSLLDGFRMSANLQGVRTAQRARDQADAARLRTRQEVLAQTARAYWELWYQGRRVDIAEQGLEVAREEQRIVSLKVEQGTLAQVEQARVDATVVQAESNLLAAQIGARSASNTLLVLVGGSPVNGLNLNTDPVAPRDLSLDPDVVVQSALDNNPEIQALRIVASNAELNVIDARHRRLPQLDVNGSFGLIGLDQAPPATPTWGWSANQNMIKAAARGRSVQTWQFHWAAGRLGRHRSGQADLRTARLDVEARERTLSQEVRLQVDSEDAARRVSLAEPTCDWQKPLWALSARSPKHVEASRKTCSKPCVQSMTPG